MKEVITIPAAVGAFVSNVRREHSLTLDQIARAARSYGASWSASSVSNIERGQASVTLPAMLLLALALGDLLGRPLTLSNLLGDAEVLALAGDQPPLDRSWVDSALMGATVTMSLEGRIDPEMDEVDEELEEEVLRRMRAVRDQGLTDTVKNDQLAQMLDESQLAPERTQRTSGVHGAGSLAEERAAKKLGVSVPRLRQIALILWGRPLDEESSRRAGNDSTPQARGRVTRVLVDELRESLQEGR